MDLTIPYKFTPRDYQLPLWQYMEPFMLPPAQRPIGYTDRGGRAACCWHRRAGKDLNCIHMCAKAGVLRPGTYWHVFPTYKQGKKIAWDGMTKDGVPFLDAFPKELVVSKNNVDMLLKTSFGMNYQVIGADKPDSLVGANPVGVIFSEWSLIDPYAWQLLQPVLAENAGWAIFIFTMRGRNHGYDMLELAKKEQMWHHSNLTVNSTKAVPMAAIDECRRTGMSEAMVEQEFYNSPDAPQPGAYYGKQMQQIRKNGQIKTFGYDPRLEVHTAWDLGMSDDTAIWFIQRVGKEHRAIDYYYRSGEGFAHYAKVLDSKPYRYGRHYGPHDLKVRELGTGKSRYETAKKMGIRFTIVQKHGLSEGIEAVRNILPNFFFNDQKCKTGISGLEQYRKKPLDENDQENNTEDESVKAYYDQPVNDWTRHPSDAFRIYAWGTKFSHDNNPLGSSKKRRQKYAKDQYRY